MSSHLHMMLSVKLSLTVNWENSKDLILLNSASFFKNLMHFNMSIMLCKAELTCWHHTAIHTLLSVKQSFAGIILLTCCTILSSCVLLCLLASYCYLALCSLSSRADSLASYCHLMPCFAHWHHTATHALLCLLTSYCYLMLCFLSSRADLLASYCHLMLCFTCWHHTAISCSAFCQAELTH